MGIRTTSARRNEGFAQWLLLTDSSIVASHRHSKHSAVEERSHDKRERCKELGRQAAFKDGRKQSYCPGILFCSEKETTPVELWQRSEGSSKASIATVGVSFRVVLRLLRSKT